MQVIPAINEISFSAVREKVRILAQFLEAGSFIHIDVVDGVFAPNVTWDDIEEFKELRREFPNFKFEIHLMVQNPESAAANWCGAGASRVIVHLETMTDPALIRKQAEQCDSEVVLAITVPTEAESLVAHAGDFKMFQILGVFPGMAGQKFKHEALAKITYLRKKVPHAIIEVDGGMDEETVKLVKNAGADLVVVSSYIFSSEHPEQAYKVLTEI